MPMFIENIVMTLYELRSDCLGPQYVITSKFEFSKTVIVCSAPEVNHYGLVSVDNDDITVGTIATYSCQPNHMMSNGNVTRSCLQNATWSGTAAVCERTYVGGAFIPADHGRHFTKIRRS
jgi:hypothetical protein